MLSVTAMLLTKLATIDVHADVDDYHIEQYVEHQYLPNLIQYLSNLDEAISDPSS